VVRFRGVDIGLQNVVYRILRTDRGDLADAEIRQWIEWLHDFVDSPPGVPKVEAATLASAVAARALTLVVVDPAAGGQCALLCETADVS